MATCLRHHCVTTLFQTQIQQVRSALSGKASARPASPESKQGDYPVRAHEEHTLSLCRNINDIAFIQSQIF